MRWLQSKHVGLAASNCTLHNLENSKQLFTLHVHLITALYRWCPQWHYRSNKISVPHVVFKNTFVTCIWLPHGTLQPRTRSYHYRVQTSQSHFRGEFTSASARRGKKQTKKHTRSPDCARRHLARKTQRILNNENTIYWRLKRTKSIIINVTYYCGDFCVSLRYPLEKKTVEQLPGAWLFSQTRWHERAHCTDDSRFLSWIFFSNSFHSRDVLPFQEMKKNLLLSIWPLIPTRAS